jgi:hypothetical protein
MVYSLSYRRPAYVSRSSMGSSDGLNSSNTSLNSGISSGIPEALSFDDIVNGGTCPVSTQFNASTHHLEYPGSVLEKQVE